MKHPPYHLRINKAVDRLLLVEVLQVLNPRDEFTYYSFAGPFLEDLRVMDHFFPKMKLVSIERDLGTFNRQCFHRFTSRITLCHKQFDAYLAHDYNAGEKDVFWLDYTGMTYKHFTEFQSVLKAVPIGSVVKITLRAQPDIDPKLVNDYLDEEQRERLRKEIEDKFERKFAKVIPPDSTGVLLPDSDYAHLVVRMIKRAASQAVDIAGSKKDFIPVQCTRYNDTTQMVSVTGLVCPQGKRNESLDLFQGLRVSNFDWDQPYEINIPDLSIKERFKLEHSLPGLADNVGSELATALGYSIDESDEVTEQQLKHYANHCREYPVFVKSPY